MLGEPRWKTWAWRVVFAAFVLWIVSEFAITFVIWAFNIPEERFGRHNIRYGERCGPEHHWVYVGPPGDPDLSCERDRP
jgi:hypothetical protein